MPASWRGARGLAGFAGRLMVVLAVSIAVGGVLAEAVGAKTEVEYSSSVALGEGLQAAAVMVWSLTSKGSVELSFTGAEAVYYIKVRGDPTRLLGETSKVGINVENEEVYHDFRGGVLIAHAVLRANPLLVAGIISSALREGQAVQANGTIREVLDVRESLIAVALPAQGAEAVTYQVHFKILGYDRAEPGQLAAFTVALAAAGTALVYASRRGQANN